jgi:low affinity Fe/Cu permease
MASDHKAFIHFARRTSAAAGRPLTFIIACSIIAIWSVTGPLFGFSDTWQLVINTGTTIITFLMVFLIQNTQNRDTEALQIKLDELIRAVKGARNEVIDLEEMDEAELEKLRHEYLALADHAKVHIEARGKAGKRRR